MGKGTLGWAPFVSLYVVLAFTVLATSRSAKGLPVKIAYQAKRCGDGRTTVVRVLKNGNVRIFDNGVQETKRAELADRLRAIFRTRAERVLFLTADSNLPFQSVADVIDISESVVDFVAIVTPAVAPGYCLSMNFPPRFFDYNYVEPAMKMKPAPIWPWPH